MVKYVQTVAFLSQQAGKKAVEGAAPHAAAIHVGTQPADSFVHLAGCLVGEGESHDVPGLATLMQQPGYLIGQYAGLARPGTGNDQFGAVHVGDGSIL